MKNWGGHFTPELGGHFELEYADNYQMQQVHGRPNHPQTQGNIERYHKTMENVVKLDNYFAPEELEAALQKFINRYNNEQYHESLNNLTPADVYFGRGEMVLKERQKIKKLQLLIAEMSAKN